jgi:hypothetical protein
MGLTVQCRIDRNAYDKGVKVSDVEMATLNIKPADFHGEWTTQSHLERPTIEAVVCSNP